MSFLNRYKYFLLAIISLLLVAIVFFSVVEKKRKQKSETGAVKQNDLMKIRKSGILKSVVDYNSTDYFVYRGKPMGFKYELLKELSKELGVKLEISVINNLSETFQGVKNGRFDVVAKSLTVTKERSKLIDFTVPILQTRQVLVQRAKQKPGADSTYIESTLQLAGKKIYIQKNTSFFKRLQSLSEEIGADITIVEDSIFGVEQLVAQVAKGNIDYTV
jgi:membrane-bound lytic murein transglycosylase F